MRLATRIAPHDVQHDYYAVDRTTTLELVIDYPLITGNWFTDDYRILSTEVHVVPWIDPMPKPLYSVDYFPDATWEYVRFNDGQVEIGDMTNAVGHREVFWAVVPEPSPYTLMAIGVAMLLISFFSGALYGGRKS
jgi:hypothetical protein